MHECIMYDDKVKMFFDIDIKVDDKIEIKE